MPRKPKAPDLTDPQFSLADYQIRYVLGYDRIYLGRYYEPMHWKHTDLYINTTLNRFIGVAAEYDDEDTIVGRGYCLVSEQYSLPMIAALRRFNPRSKRHHAYYAAVQMMLLEISERAIERGLIEDTRLRPKKVRS